MEYTCVDASNNETAGSADWRLEFAGVAGLAPADQDAFFARFHDKRLVSPLDPLGSVYYVEFVSRTRIRELDAGDIYMGTYTYEKTGANMADLVFEYDDGDRCDHDITFRTETSGDSTEVCTYDGTTMINWQTTDRP